LVRIQTHLNGSITEDRVETRSHMLAAFGRVVAREAVQAYGISTDIDQQAQRAIARAVTRPGNVDPVAIQVTTKTLRKFSESERHNRTCSEVDERMRAVSQATRSASR
jgi:hypothetical protein